MAFGHERMHVYRAAIDYLGWAYSVNEDPPQYGTQANDSDSDTDSDPDKSCNSPALDGNKRRRLGRS